MISPKVFRKHSFDAKALKEIFRKRRGYTYAPEVQHLVDLLRSRIQDGIAQNLKDYRFFAAADYAYDAPYYQTTPTIVQHICNQKLTYEDSKKVVEGWGLQWSDLFRVKMKHDNPEQPLLVDGKPQIEVIAASLVKTIIPLVKSYLTIRCAKLYTDRDQIPLFKFEPLRLTDENAVLCEVLNNIIEAQVTQFGYRNELRDVILHTLLYGIQLLFPQEAWYVEKQEDADGRESIRKEGIRYLQPHPTRFFYDYFYRTSSFNSDTGCEYSGHWRVERYGSIRRDKNYFNQGAIPYGTNWFKSPLSGTYFSDFYAPCTMVFPQLPPARASSREDRAGNYSVDDEDKALFVTEMFCKLKPSEWGLCWQNPKSKEKAKPYEHPVWFRFVMGSDDTVVYAEPLAYAPNIYFGYDADGNRVRNAGMALELIPSQDQLGNILSQIVLTVKQNLANVVFYDKNIVDEAQVRSLQNSGELSLRGINLVAYDSHTNLKAGLDTRAAFNPVQMGKQNTAELFQSLNTIISIAERLLAFSAQELGGTATHQQSAQEIKTITANVGVRVAYTGTFIDDGIDAWKKQLADAFMAYMDPEFVAEVSPDTKNLPQILKKLGFSIVSDGGQQSKTKVKGSKEKVMPLLLDGLVSTKDGPDRGTDSQAANAMIQVVGTVANNPALAQEVGGRQLLKLLQRAAVMGGAPRDFKLETTGKTIEQQQAEQQQSEQVQGQAPQALTPEQVVQLINEEQKKLTKELVDQVIKPAAEMDAQQEQKIAGLEQAVMQIGEAVGKLTTILQTAAAAPQAQPQIYDALTGNPPTGAPPPDPAAAGQAGSVVDRPAPAVV